MLHSERKGLSTSSEVRGQPAQIARNIAGDAAFFTPGIQAAGSATLPQIKMGRAAELRLDCTPGKPPGETQRQHRQLPDLIRSTRDLRGLREMHPNRTNDIQVWQWNEF